MRFSHRIVHVSDLHFGSQHLTDVSAILEHEIHAARPDVLVVSGDLTRWSSRREFTACATWLRQFDVPKMIVPGNHDVNWFHVPDQLFNRLRVFNKYTADQNQCVLRLPKLSLFGIDSTRSFAIASGRVSSRELAWLEHHLSQTPADHVRIVVLHHPLFAIPNSGVDLYPLLNAKRVLRLLRAYEVDLVLCGHRHVAHLRIDESRTRRQTTHQLAVVHCGTSASKRYRKAPRNNYNIIDINPERLRIEQRIWQPGDDGFCVLDEHTLPNPKTTSESLLSPTAQRHQPVT